MQHTQYQNPDLAWDLEEFTQRSRATDFISQFQSTLCVYSPTVDLLYARYEIIYPEEADAKLVILPDKDAYYDTFTRIVSDGVKPTGLYIIPGELVHRQGLYLANVTADRKLGTRQIPFEAGVRAIMKSRPKDDPFLPVLTKGDLREFEQSWPVIHLHRISLPAMSHLSALDRTSIGNVIAEKMESLFKSQRSPLVA